MAELNWVDIRGWVALVLSCWGAVLSTVLAVRTLVTDRPRLRLDAWLQCTHFKGGQPVWRTRMSVLNRGRRPVELTQIAVEYKSGHLFWHDKAAHEDAEKLPRTLSEGQTLVLNAYSGHPPGEGGDTRIVRVGIRASGRPFFVRVRDHVETVFH
jgi:hypothetical protein